MPRQFDKLGISFLYPDNWTLEEEGTLAGKRCVTVSSPGGGFWSVSVHPRSSDPADLARTVVDTMREEYKDLESEDMQETVAGRALVGYDLGFLFLDFTNTATIRCTQTDQATYAVFCQAEDREFDQLRQVFLAITISLLREIV